MKAGLALAFPDPRLAGEWARRADAGPFDRISVPDRVVFETPDPLVVAATVAAVTTRIHVQTGVLLGPLRDPVLLARECATLDRLSGGRFTLGLGVGERAEDYRAVGRDLSERGRRLDENLAVMTRVWHRQPPFDGVGPVPATEGGPPLLFGGLSTAALRRMARWGIGYVFAGTLGEAPAAFETARRLWREAGRAGEPLLIAEIDVAPGPESTRAAARRAISRYFAYSPELASSELTHLATTETAIAEAVRTARTAGADEVVFACWSDDPGQVDRLAQVVSSWA